MFLDWSRPEPQPAEALTQRPLRLVTMPPVDPFKAFESLGTGLQLPVGVHRVPVHAIEFIGLLLLLVAVLPVWPYSRTWGPHPSGAAGMLIILFLVLVLFGYL